MYEHDVVQVAFVLLTFGLFDVASYQDKKKTGTAAKEHATKEYIRKEIITCKAYLVPGGTAEFGSIEK